MHCRIKKAIAIIIIIKNLWEILGSCFIDRLR